MQIDKNQACFILMPKEELEANKDKAAGQQDLMHLSCLRSKWLTILAGGGPTE